MMLAARLALGTWRASGPRTLDRLDSLVEHYAATTALPPAILPDVQQEARAAVRCWEIEPCGT
jgi:hypothetical protein